MTSLLSPPNMTATAELHVEALHDWLAGTCDSARQMATLHFETVRSVIDGTAAGAIAASGHDAEVPPRASDASPLTTGAEYAFGILAIGFESQREFLRLLDRRYAGLAEGYAVELDRAAVFPPAAFWAMTAAAQLRAGFAAFTAAWRSVARTVRQVVAMNEAGVAGATTIIEIGSARLLPCRQTA